MNAQIEITREIAQKCLDTVDAGLVRGKGKPVPGQMCVEAAVCYAMGLPHGDNPTCVSPALRSLKICLNDACWSSNKARAAGLRRLALIQLGSKGALNDLEFVQRLAPLVKNAVSSASAAAAAADAASASAADAAAYAAYASAASADAAAASAARAAAYAASAYAYAYAYAAAYAADAVANANAAYAVARAAADAVLNQFAEGVVQILIDMKVPGVQWLSLTEA